MTPIFRARRAAEEFDEVLAGTAGAQVAERHAELARTVELLRDHEPVQPRTEFVADLRERLMAAAETELVPAAARERDRVRALELPRTERRKRHLGTAAAALVILGGSTGMAVAASGSLPGEPLYPIKRGVEDISTALRLGDAAQGRALLGQADNRLDEVEALIAGGDADRDVIVATVDSFGSTADQGAQKLFEAYRSDRDPADIEAVRAFTTEEMGRLDALLRGVDPGTAGLLVDAVDVLAELDQQARELCSSCGPEAAVRPPALLSEGVAAISVDNLVARPAKQAALDRAQAAARATAELKSLKQAAEKQAAVTPQVTVPGGTESTTTSPRRGPLVSLLLPRDRAAPSSTRSAPVKDLLTGVTGTLDGVTGVVTGDDGTVGKTGKKLGGAVKKTTGGVTDTVDGLTGGKTEGLTDKVDGLTDKLLP